MRTIKIKFLGGVAGKLTGSCYLIIIEFNEKILRIFSRRWVNPG